MKIKLFLNELDLHFVINMMISVGMFLMGVFWDGIAEAFHIRHSVEGVPVLQIIWCVFWALDAMWTWHYMRYYGK